MAKIVAVFLLVAIVAQSSAASKLKCYQCPSALEGCEASAASAVTCSGEQPHCTKMVAKGAANDNVAIRKCVLFDIRTNSVPCTANYDCHSCNSDLCNAAPVIKGGVVVAMILSLITANFIN